ncbi:MAG: amidohydrolase [Deltaproteobacteria bacterium]|nr:amidohydrolase [Deltaproteobacteria bacterium]
MGQTAKETVSLLITGDWVLTQNEAREVFHPGAVAIRGEEIVAAGPAAEICARFTPERRLDYPLGLIMPGLINAHTHAAMSLFRGLADAVARAVDETGIRAVVGEVLYDFPSPNYGPPAAGLAFSEELCRTWQGHPRVSVAIQPHAVYTCSPNLLQECGELADKYDRRLIIHLSETQQEVADCEKRYGATPVAHLHRLGLLTNRLLADHAVVLTGADMELLAASGSGVAHCPESNMKLASGIAPVEELLQRSVAVGLGTDGCASNNNLDLVQEMDTAAKLQKGRYLDPTVLPATATLDLATRGSAKVLGLEGQVGTLGPGLKADVLVLDLDQPHLTPLYDPYSHLVYAAGGGDVQTVVVHGQVVVQDRRILSFDLEETLAKTRELAKALGAVKLKY